MYQQDWIIRQIRNMVRMIAKIVFKKESVTYELNDETNQEGTDLLYKELLGLLASLKINEAENLLFERMESDDIKYLTIAIDFYSRLNELSDEELDKGKFTREEIKDGLGDALKAFGINIADEISLYE